MDRGEERQRENRCAQAGKTGGMGVDGIKRGNEKFGDEEIKMYLCRHIRSVILGK